MTQELYDVPVGPGRIECRGVLALAREAIIAPAAEPLPREAEIHLETCPRCRDEVDEIARVEAVISGALRSARRSIPGPSPREIDAILGAVREQSPSAKLLSRIRRSVNRMLWLTLLVLSFLLICVVAWAILNHLKAFKGG